MTTSLERFWQGRVRSGWRPWSSCTDEANLPRVLAAGADLVGINNRDLKRFVTDLDLTLRLRDRVPRRFCWSARAASAAARTLCGCKTRAFRPSSSAKP